MYPVTAANGKVHSGNGAMALDINYGNSLESGYMMTALQYTGDEKTFENATKLGMWIYISDEDVATWIRYTVYPLVLNSDGEYVKGSDFDHQHTVRRRCLDDRFCKSVSGTRLALPLYRSQRI